MTATRRPGLSLVEVLVALFIMGIGAIAILTLFPLGALQMGQALKDDRTAQAAGQADAYIRWYWKNYVVETNADTGLAGANSAFENPGAPLPVLSTTTNAGEPSYPVAADPMGNYTWGGNAQSWVAYPYQSVPRRNLNQITQQFQALRVCSLLDGYGFNPQSYGQPNDPATGIVDREYRYNWLWVLQRPNVADRNTVTMTVVVFDDRPPFYARPSAEVAFNPVANGAAVGSTSVQFASGTNLQVRKGGWILDATSSGSVRNANFYRVVSVTDNPTAGTVDVELQVPLKPDTKPSWGTDISAANANSRTFIVLAGVSEVFERPNLTGTDAGY